MRMRLVHMSKWKGRPKPDARGEQPVTSGTSLAWKSPELIPRLAAVLARGSAPFAAAAVPGLLCDPYGLLEQPAAAASLAARLPLFADWLPLFAA